MDKHLRPYKCTDHNCKSKDFGTAGDLKRHRHSAHGTRVHTCPVSSCKRHRHGFTRKDNLTDHMKRIHKNPQDLNEQEATVNCEGLGSANDSPSESGSEDENKHFQSLPKELTSSVLSEKTYLFTKLRELEEKRAALDMKKVEFDEQIAAMKMVLTII
ncbi:hypothetical protein B0J14DRAFT_572418 [Halenospora varia]|nr:hypothetical protein B0J14DRAFT_572418 [Halenospora varia]